MVFASGVFLYYFLPLFLAVYYLGPRSLRSLVIAVASYVFYGWWRPDFVILMWISTVVDYGCGRSILRERAAGGRGKRWVVLSLCVNLGLLAYFKYANFGVDTLNAILASAGSEPVRWTEVVLPVGISFYTFQTLSYTVDVYRGHAPPVRSFRDFMCYVALFPQLVAGPIVRYNTVAEQLRERSHTLAKFFQGALLFQMGLAKKVLIADTVGGVADEAFAASALSTLDAWLGTVFYAFQIYFDFSGYSDMAIGLGLMIGFRFPINFDQPYRSISITDFWRRWHVSLSAFLRDYLYVPLGGNRRGPVRTYVNLSATMLLGGLWHGAAWTFIAWGAYQGLWLVIERLAGKRSLLGWAPRPLQMAGTFALVLVGWVFFRAESLPSAFDTIGAMLGLAASSEVTATLDVRTSHLLALVAAAAVTWLLPTSQDVSRRARATAVVATQLVFVWALVHLHQDHVPFLYFQF